MKKLFTLFASATLLAGAASAEVKTTEIEMNFRNWSTGENMAEPQTTTISYEDGVYTINEFMNSTRIIQFTLNADTYTTDGEKNYCVEIPSEYFDGDFLLPGGNYYKTYLYGYNGTAADEKTTVNYIQGYPTSSYIKAWSPEEYDTPIYFCFCMRVMCGSETSDWMYFDFYMPDLAGILSASDEPVVPGDEAVTGSIYIDFFSDKDDSWLGGEETTVTYKDGTYYIDNFMDTGLALPIILSNDVSAYALNEWNSDATFGTENLYDYYGDGMPYLYNYETGKYATGTLGEQAATYIYVAEGYIYVMKVDADEEGYDFYVDLWAAAYLDDVWTGFYVDFYMNDLAGIFNETAVETVEPSEASAEYYNLQGVRVINPEKGLYIMRQGDKAVKVMK